VKYFLKSSQLSVVPLSQPQFGGARLNWWWSETFNTTCYC